MRTTWAGGSGEEGRLRGVGVGRRDIGEGCGGERFR